MTWGVTWEQNDSPQTFNKFIMELSFLTPTKFSTLIEEMVQEKHLSYMDACLEYCKDNNVEPESLGRLVNKALKQNTKNSKHVTHMSQKGTHKLTLFELFFRKHIK